LFLNLSDWLPQVAEATPAFASSVAWLRPAASCSLTEKLQDVNAVSVFNTMFIDTMFIVLVSQGKSRKSSEKCWYLDQEPSHPLILPPDQSPCSVLGLRCISKVVRLSIETRANISTVPTIKNQEFALQRVSSVE
jgi:hypothetical protein